MQEITLQESPLSFSTSLQKGSVERDRDNLDLLPYAESLRDFIHECETPMTIGIQGDWGIGKTSMLNMLRGDEEEPKSGLLMKTRCKVVNFDTWSYAQFNQEEHLAIACLYALTKKVSECVTEGTDLDPDAEKTSKSARNLIASVLKNVKVNVAGVSLDVADVLSDSGRETDQSEPFDFVDIAEQMIKFKQQFQELVRLWVGDDDRKRIVIFVDDLDRIKPIRALELLEAVKNFLDVNGCVFVIAVDYEVVQMGMAEKLGKDLQKTSGKSFFDKIIQLPFSMPYENYRLDDYIMGLLKKAGFPYADKLSTDEESKAFFHDITICTVGRNPRSIKRVMNYANLLERIRQKNAGRNTSSKDSQILYALICMQIAWPELFGYFLQNPNGDTINNLENWEFLDTLPEARKLFSRSTDTDKIKNDISTFIDTLFGVLDLDGDGVIDAAELAPVLNVMQIAKLTSVETKERPRDFFVNLVGSNCRDGANSTEKWFLDNVYSKSIWFLGSEIQYKKSGTRYITSIIDRRQIGSLVTLKTNPFIFRLGASPHEIMENMDPSILKKMLDNTNSDSCQILKSLSAEESSLTGFGATRIDLDELWKGTKNGQYVSLAIECLDDIYRACKLVSQNAKRG